MNNTERYAQAGPPDRPAIVGASAGHTAAASPAVAKTSYRFLILALITIVLALSTGDRAALSVAGTDMGKELGISSVDTGYLFSAFSWA